MKMWKKSENKIGRKRVYEEAEDQQINECTLKCERLQLAADNSGSIVLPYVQAIAGGIIVKAVRTL